jgi:hypothetical protein
LIWLFSFHLTLFHFISLASPIPEALHRDPPLPVSLESFCVRVRRSLLKLEFSFPTAATDLIGVYGWHNSATPIATTSSQVWFLELTVFPQGLGFRYHQSDWDCSNQTINRQLPVKCNHFIYDLFAQLSRSRDSVVGMATSYGLDDRVVGVRVPVGWIMFSSPRRPDLIWRPPYLLSNGYRGLFP